MKEQQENKPNKSGCLDFLCGCDVWGAVCLKTQVLEGLYKKSDV